MCVCMCVFVCMCLCVCMCVFVCVCSCVFVCMPMCVGIHDTNEICHEGTGAEGRIDL